jgi:hypothetical protein
MGIEKQGHVRYPLYNVSKNETMKKYRKEGKSHGKIYTLLSLIRISRI